jgi:hypothetical protein
MEILTIVVSSKGAIAASAIAQAALVICDGNLPVDAGVVAGDSTVFCSLALFIIFTFHT